MKCPEKDGARTFLMLDAAANDNYAKFHEDITESVMYIVSSIDTTLKIWNLLQKELKTQRRGGLGAKEGCCSGGKRTQ